MAIIVNNNIEPFTEDNPVTGPDDVPAVDIFQSDLTADDLLAKYIDEGSDQTIWTDYKINNRYESDQHKYMAGITSPNGFGNQSVAFFQMASPTLLWICDWTAARWNEMPEIPDPYNPTDTDWVLLDIIPETAMITLAGDGITPLYRISGTYVFGHKNPRPNIFYHVNFGRAAWIQDVFQRFVIPADVLEVKLMDTRTGAGGGGAGGFGGAL